MCTQTPTIPRLYVRLNDLFRIQSEYRELLIEERFSWKKKKLLLCHKYNKSHTSIHIHISNIAKIKTRNETFLIEPNDSIGNFFCGVKKTKIRKQECTDYM